MSFSENVEKLWEAELVNEAFVKFVKSHADDLNTLSLRTYEGDNSVPKLQDEQECWALLRVATALFMDFKNKPSTLKDIAAFHKLLCEQAVVLPKHVLVFAGTQQETFIDQYALDAQPGMQVYKTLSDLSGVWSTHAGASVHMSCMHAGEVAAGLKLLDANAAYCKSSSHLGVFLEPWHVDILQFLSYESPSLQRVVWVPDLFMHAVEDDKEWYLMDPATCGGLANVSGDMFSETFHRHVSSGSAACKIKATEVWEKILESGASIAFKDAINAINPVPHGYTVKGCSVGHALTSTDSHAVTAQATLFSDKFWDPEAQSLDLHRMHAASKLITRALNRVLDITVYATKEAHTYAEALRPLSVALEAEDARLSENDTLLAWETVYHGSLSESVELAKNSQPYFCYKNSTASCGIIPDAVSESNWDWKCLKTDLARYGRRNAFLTAMNTVTKPRTELPKVSKLLDDQTLAYVEHPVNVSATDSIDVMKAWKHGMPVMLHF